MAKPQGIIPSPQAWAEIVDTVRHTRVNRPVRKARRSPRRRNSGSGGGSVDVTGTLGAAWTTSEYEPTTGACIKTFYRGTSRTQNNSWDQDVILTSAGKLFTNGSTNVLGDNPIGALFDATTGEMQWVTDRNGKTAISDLTTYSSAAQEQRSGRHVLEASDGFLWIGGNSAVARVDPGTGEFTHRIATVAGLVYLYPCPNSGAVIIRPGTFADTDRLSIISSSGTRTHGYSATTPIDVSEGDGVLVVASSGNVTTLDASDLSSISSANVTGTEVSAVTDGTTVWCLQDEATDQIRAFSVNDLTTGLWNANAVGVTTAFLAYNPVNGYIYHYNGTTLSKIDPTDGSVEWTTGTLGASVRSCRHWVGFGSDFVIISVRIGTAANLYCLEDSDGSTRWSDYNGRSFDLNVSAYNMWSHGVCVTGDDRVFVCHGYKQQ